MYIYNIFILTVLIVIDMHSGLKKKCCVPEKIFPRFKILFYICARSQKGEMAERSNAAVFKTVISGDRDRGFESHSLLQLRFL